MKHFHHLNTDKFLIEPEEIDPLTAEKSVLALSLGATLYSPSTRPDLVSDVQKNYRRGVSSMVICLEDAIADNDVAKGEANIVKSLPEIAKIPSTERPLIFIRVRSAEQLSKVIDENYDHLDVLTGFVFPKFDPESLPYIHALKNVNGLLEKDGRKTLYFMPVLESPELVYHETRNEFLIGVKSLLDDVRDLVLAVRIGATDMSSVYGMRRSPDMVVYDNGIIASAIYDIMNIFSRHGDGHGDDGYQVTGPVWEHFHPNKERLFKPKLRVTLFADERTKMVREYLVKNRLDKFIEEIHKDKTNNIFGKTVIHPSHVSIVNALCAVSHEDYMDALAIVGTDKNETGAVASSYNNKMNEQKPHTPWALKMLERARVYGVLKEGIQTIELFIEEKEKEIA